MVAFLSSLKATLVTKILSFILTTMTLRLIPPSLLGATAIKLELLLSTCLFLGREPIRLACCQSHARHSHSQSIHSLSYFAIPVTTSISLLLLFFTSPSLSQISTTTILYCLSTIIESTAEPQIIKMMIGGDISLKSYAEGVAVAVKSLSLYLMLTVGSNLFSDQLVSFGVSQILYSLTFVAFVNRTIFFPMPLPLPSFSPIHPKLLYLTFSFFLQSILKHVLTEGDKLVLTYLSSSYDAGIYAMASSYGSIVSRLLFQPLEENGRLIFSTNSSPFTTLTKTCLYLGLTFSTFGSTYCYIVLKVLAGAEYFTPAGVSALQAYCVYTAFLAVNGMAEAFMYAHLETAKDVRFSSLVLLVVGGGFAGLAWLLVERLGWGVEGVIVANCVTMGVRGLVAMDFSIRVLVRESNNKKLKYSEVVGDLAPDWAVLVLWGVAFAGINLWGRGRDWVAILTHFGVGVGLFSILMVAVWVREGRWRRDIKVLVSGSTSTSRETKLE